jgi:hypothetical protein
VACLQSMEADSVQGLIEMTNYHPAESDDASDLLVPRRVRMRDRYPIKVFKCVARGGLHSDTLAIEPGNHGVMFSGQRQKGVNFPSLLLAHYGKRSPVRLLVKAVIGRLKVVAAGQAEVKSGRSSHYTSFMEKMLHDPSALLKNANFMENRNGGQDIVEDRIDYRGTPLRYTARGDDTDKSIRILAQYCQALAENHGRILDSQPMLRQEVNAWNCSLNHLM